MELISSFGESNIKIEDMKNIRKLSF